MQNGSMKVVVTGANRGLGLSIVEALLAGGATVIAGVRTSAARLEELAREHGARLLVQRMDVTSEEEVAEAARIVRGRYQTITHIVNNAAILRGRGDGAAKLPMKDFEESFAINTFGPLLVCKHFLPLIAGPTDGIQVFNVSSTSGSIARVERLDYSYSMSKAALNMYTVMLRWELAERGIAVAAFHPGWMHTDMGGTKAPLDPDESARTIVGLLDGSASPPDESAFFDVELRSQPF